MTGGRWTSTAFGSNIWLGTALTSAGGGLGCRSAGRHIDVNTLEWISSQEGVTLCSSLTVRGAM